MPAEVYLKINYFIYNFQYVSIINQSTAASLIGCFRTNLRHICLQRKYYAHNILI